MRKRLPMSEAQVNELVVRALREKAEVETLSHHSHDVSSRLVIRAWRTPSQSVVVKMWRHYKLRHKIRQWLRLSSAQCEVRNLATMKHMGIRVPTPLGFAHLTPDKNCKFDEAVVMEDFGKCRTGTEHIRALIAAERDDQLQSFENSIIGMVEAMIGAAIIDRDFTVDNIVICGGDELRRIDVEIARRVFSPRISHFLSSEMISPLLATYTWAVYPNAELVPRFMRKLRDRLGLSRLIWLRTKHAYDRILKKYGHEHGGLTFMRLPWNSVPSPRT